MSNLSPPQQQRSRKTLNAISDATKELLKSHTFAELTIDQIIKEAGSSTGSFYARFKGKRALLHHLHEAFAEESKTRVNTFVETIDRAPMDIQEFADLWVPDAVQSHFDAHGILRATMMETFDDPQFAIRAGKLIRHVATKLSEVVVNRSSSRDEHVRNVERSMRVIMTVLDQDMLYLRKGRPRKLSAEKIDWLKRIFVASLGGAVKET